MSKKNLLDALAAEMIDMTGGGGDAKCLRSGQLILSPVGSSIICVTKGRPKFHWLRNLWMLKNRFLAVLSVVIEQVTRAKYTYWAYAPNPTINAVVNWGDTDISVVVNELFWLPGPHDK